jgi:hypothetical protein
VTSPKDLDRRVATLGDRLSYVLLYAPDFPREDETTVEHEFDKLVEQVHTLWKEVQDVERRGWLDLLGRELVEAKAAFVEGDTKKGACLIQSAEERLASWHSRKRVRSTFIVGPDGDTKKVDDPPK